MTTPTAKQRLWEALMLGKVPKHLVKEVRELLAEQGDGTLRAEIEAMFEEAQGINSGSKHKTPNLIGDHNSNAWSAKSFADFWDKEEE